MDLTKNFTTTDKTPIEIPVQQPEGSVVRKAQYPAVFASADLNTIYVWGGMNRLSNSTALTDNSLFAYDVLGKFWSQPEVKGSVMRLTWGNRVQASPGSTMYYTDGTYDDNSKVRYNGVLSLSLPSLQWSNISSGSNFTRPYYATASITSSGLIVQIGGVSGDGMNANMTTVDIFDTKTGVWQRKEVAGNLPNPRTSHCQVSGKHLLTLS
jgi:hypothetical protein